MGFQWIEAQRANPTREAVGNPQVKLIALYVNKTGKSATGPYCKPVQKYCMQYKKCRLQGSTKVLSTFVLLATKDPLTDLSSSLLSSFTSCESQWLPDSSLFAQNWKFSCKLAKLYPKQQTRGVSYWGVLAIYIKNYLKAKEESWETQIFHPAKI
jgi:hypothetical protein